MSHSERNPDGRDADGPEKSGTGRSRSVQVRAMLVSVGVGALCVLSAAALVLSGTGGGGVRGPGQGTGTTQPVSENRCAVSDPVACATSEIDAAMSASGPRGGMVRLLELRKANDAVEASCHVLTHHIGQQAIESGRPVAELLSLDDEQCLWGYQHGVLEGWAMRVSAAELRAGLAAACAVYPEGSSARGSCSHGLGHAIAMQGPASLLEAAALCDLTAQSERVGCFGGAAMAFGSGEASQGGTSTGVELPLSEEDVRSVCAAVNTLYREECGAKLWLLAERVGMGLEEGVAACPAEHQDACERGFGTKLYYDNGQDGARTLDRCSTTRFADNCALGVAWAAANTWVGMDRPVEQYESLCSKVRTELRERCLEQEQRALKLGR